MRRIYGNKVLLLTFSAIFLAGGINYAAAAPTNTSLPSITGEATVGTSLTVNTGSWSSTQVTFNIQWFSCSTNLSTSCVAQSGRTTGTYLVTTSDLTRYIRASVTALDATGGSTVFTTLVGPVVTPPQASVLPVITGVATPGSVLQATRGTWSGAAATGDQYQWLRCTSIDTSNCTVISTGSGNTYTVQNSDTGFRLAVNVIVRDITNRISGSAKSLTTQPVLGSPTVSSTPTFTSNLYVGGTATLDRGTWSTAGNTTYLYQWQRCSTQAITACLNISGATTASYPVSQLDLNQYLRVAVTAINEVGGSTIYSGFSAQVAATAPPVNTSIPIVSGSAFETLIINIISKGQWSGIEESKLLTQWQICSTAISCSDIPSATSPTYTASSADVGKTIRVKIIAPYSQKNVEAFSNQTLIIKKAYTNVFPPTLLSYADIGDKIDIFKGYWEGLSISNISYVWQRCKSATSCTNIPGATKSTYTPSSSDRGYSIRVGERPSPTTAYAFSEISNKIAALVVAKKSITCVKKGKKAKKVTAVKPKCPKGYKKK
jgi:large repetitive protein